MKTLSISITSFLLSIISPALYAQPNTTGWLASFNTIGLGKKTSLHSDIQLRSTDGIAQLQTLLLRPGINFHVNKTVTLTAGYAFISNKRIVSNVAGYAPEHRIWEQLLINCRWGKIAMAHRFRAEQRFLGQVVARNNELENNGNKYANRFRYFIRNILPLNKETPFKKGPFAALQNEVFLNFASGNSVNGETFDQNRLYLAVGYRLHTSFDLEAGYMNQYINGTGNAFTNNHVIQVAGYLRL